MKLSLVVLTPGKMEGKVIPVAQQPFEIGRDSTCQLRPTSPTISHRHCALLIRDNKAILQDLKSTNGTFLNEQKVEGEAELRDQDVLTVGPLMFGVRLEVPVTVERPTPLPAAKPASNQDDLAASLLLSVGDESLSASSMSSSVDDQGVPTGSTVLETVKFSAVDTSTGTEAPKEAKSKYDEAKKAAADTSTAASAILAKYMRRR